MAGLQRKNPPYVGNTRSEETYTILYSDICSLSKWENLEYVMIIPFPYSILGVGTPVLLYSYKLSTYTYTLYTVKRRLVKLNTDKAYWPLAWCCLSTQPTAARSRPAAHGRGVDLALDRRAPA